ncbi:MAG: hypothetical protein ABI977_09120, partial [Acidobacteriota bacterium]
MSEKIKILALLQSVVPSSTPVTISSEMKILEILGIVSNPELAKAMQLASALIPATTPATLKGLVQLLSSLMRMNPKTTKDHHDTLTKLLTGLANIPDVALTFGTFLPICESLSEAS